MENKRPTLVTVICILGFIDVLLGTIGTIYMIFSGNLAIKGIVIPVIPIWLSVFVIFINIFYFVSLIYIWKMKKIGLIAYSGFFILNFIVLLIFGLVMASSIIIGAISVAVTEIVDIVFLGLLWTQFKKMSWGYNLNEDSSVQDSIEQVPATSIGQTSQQINKVDN